MAIVVKNIRKNEKECEEEAVEGKIVSRRIISDLFDQNKTMISQMKEKKRGIMTTASQKKVLSMCMFLNDNILFHG